MRHCGAIGCVRNGDRVTLLCLRCFLGDVVQLFGYKKDA